MFHPLRALKRTTGLWIARAVVTELRGVRAELAALREELTAQGPRHAPVSINVGQGFVTARPDGQSAGGEAGGIDATTDQRFREYAQVATELTQNFGRAATTEEIEREWLLRTAGES